jgi:hypothetical protein
VRNTYSADLEEIADQLVGGPAGAVLAGAQPAPADSHDADSSPAHRALSAAAATGAAFDDTALPAACNGGGAPLRVRAGDAGGGSPTAAAAAADGGPSTPPPPSPRNLGRLSLDLNPAANGAPGGAGGPAAPGAASGGPLVGSALSTPLRAGPRLLAAKSKYVVLLLDSADAALPLGALLSRKGRAALAAAVSSTGASVGVGVASAYGLSDTLALLGGAGLVSAAQLDFAVTDCGAQIWYTAAAAGAAGAAGGSMFPGLDGAGAAADEAYSGFLDFRWDKPSVRRLLAHLLAHRTLLTGLSGGAASGPPPAARISVDTDTGPHHLLLTLRRKDAPPGGAARAPVLPARELAALVARIKRRFRAGGVRTQITAQAEADGSARIHVTPLRASRALALRYLALRHGVDMTDLAFVRWAAPGGGESRGVCALRTRRQQPAPRSKPHSPSPPAAPALPPRSCARRMPPGEPAAFAASDAADLIGGVQSVLVVPPGGPAGAAAGLDGFPVDLELFKYDDRLQIMGAQPAE